MTNQEAFDTIVAFLIRQGEPAMEGSKCLLRTHNGLKCAVGCLIPDEKYAVELENLLIEDLVDEGYIEGNPDFLATMQGAHDTAAAGVLMSGNFVRTFLSEARKVAKDFALDATVCEVRV